MNHGLIKAGVQEKTYLGPLDAERDFGVVYHPVERVRSHALRFWQLSRGGLLRQGFNQVRAVDIKPPNQWFQKFPQADNCSLDLREKDNCYRALENADHVYNLAADVGGMGVIERDCVERGALNVG